MSLVLAAALAAAPAGTDAQPAPQTIYATQSGRYAYDADDFGGNPFASALIWALKNPGPKQIERLELQTGDYSGGYQVADGSGAAADTALNPASGERSVALVIVCGDYGDIAGLPSLPGAAFDAARVTSALARAGYDARTVVASDAAAYRDALAAFAERSRDADRALLYTTAHGTEPARGEAYLLPPDRDRMPDPTLADTIPLREVAKALRASKTNLLLYAGCRERGLPRSGPRARS
jgi:hypothetical protein